MSSKQTSRLVGSVLVLVGVGLLSVLYAGSNQSVANANGQIGSMQCVGKDGVTLITDNPILCRTEGPTPIPTGPAANNRRVTYDPVGNESQSPRYQPIQVGQRNIDAKSQLGNCAANAEALAVGIKHYKYSEAAAADLVTIQGGRKLHRDAAASLQDLLDAAKHDNTVLNVGSAYRAVSYQQGIVDRKKNQGQSNKAIYSASAPAGHSEHHTGYVVDFTPIESSFAETKGYRWLQANAAKFGWEQSFTPEYSKTSGVMIEPWHWRYVGTDTAKRALIRSDC